VTYVVVAVWYWLGVGVTVAVALGHHSAHTEQTLTQMLERSTATQITHAHTKTNTLVHTQHTQVHHDTATRVVTHVLVHEFEPDGVSVALHNTSESATRASTSRATRHYIGVEARYERRQIHARVCVRVCRCQCE
jgi:hypothetical protein